MVTFSVLSLFGLGFFALLKAYAAWTERRDKHDTIALTCIGIGCWYFAFSLFVSLWR